MSNSAENNNLITVFDIGDALYRMEKKRNKSTFIRTLIIGLFVIIILFSEALFVTLYTGIYIVDGSMSPTLTGANGPTEKGGDYIYINTYAKPDYGDIVVVYNPHTSSTGIDKLIKRVVAFGGDRVKIEAGVLYVNDNPVEENYISSKFNSEDITFDEYEVLEGCMFLLGDNRIESQDSRSSIYRDIPLKNLVGVVPKWSMRTKGISTAFYTYFHFTIFGN